MNNFPSRRQIDRAGDIKFGDDPSFAENASAKLARKRAEAQRAADALNSDTLGKAPLETVPEPPAPPLPTKPKPAIVLSFTTIYRGRQITITGEHMELDTFCDLLDKKFGVAS